MNLLLGILCALAALFSLVLACYRSGHDVGQQDGFHEGFQRGFQDGHKAASDWLVNLDHEVTRMQKTIQDEEKQP